MPVLVPSFLPPPPVSASPAVATPTKGQPLAHATSGATLSAISPSTAPTSIQPQKPPQTSLETDARESNIPIVTLPHHTLSPELAAALASSMLGHVLFLKGQIPLPAAQLARLPQPLNATKAKKRTELLETLDLLNSHLQTTFRALAEALAQRGEVLELEKDVIGEKGKGKENVGAGVKEDVVEKSVGNVKGKEEESGEAQMVFAVGPTPGAPKARVIFALRGLALSMREEEEEESSEGEESSEDEEEDDDEGDTSDDLDASSSRAPSPPSSQPFSDPTPPAPRPSFTPYTSDSPSARPPLTTKLPLSTRPPLNPTTSNGCLSTYTTSAPPRLNPSSRLLRTLNLNLNAHSEGQATIRAAERVLGKTLAEDGRLAAGGELAPTHTHILIRAPRRFSHPAWRPRAQLNSSLDACVADALSSVHSQKKAGAKKVEGVLIRSLAGEGEVEREKESRSKENEDDEMIWWIWEGRLSGFADW